MQSFLTNLLLIQILLSVVEGSSLHYDHYMSSNPYLHAAINFRKRPGKQKYGYELCYFENQRGWGGGSLMEKSAKHKSKSNMQGVPKKEYSLIKNMGGDRWKIRDRRIICIFQRNGLYFQSGKKSVHAEMLSFFHGFILFLSCLSCSFMLFLWFHHVLFLLFFVQSQKSQHLVGELINCAPKDGVYIGCLGGADRTFACKSQECLWQDWYISNELLYYFKTNFLSF